tara:strand:+ start:1172 stop:1408 length:237 start_codon:yes stop_codon:yes gene_type:complete
MMRIQNKVVEHVSDLLDSIETFEVYSRVSKVIESFDIERDQKHEILNQMTEAQNKYITNNVEEAKEWIKTLLEDLNGA